MGGQRTGKARPGGAGGREGGHHNSAPCPLDSLASKAFFSVRLNRNATHRYMKAQSCQQIHHGSLCKYDAEAFFTNHFFSRIVYHDQKKKCMEAITLQYRIEQAEQYERA